MTISVITMSAIMTFVSDTVSLSWHLVSSFNTIPSLPSTLHCFNKTIETVKEKIEKSPSSMKLRKSLGILEEQYHLSPDAFIVNNCKVCGI